LRSAPRFATFENMILAKTWIFFRAFFLGASLCFATNAVLARPRQRPIAAPRLPAAAIIQKIDDSLILKPAKDLSLQPENQRKADALSQFVEGARLEENGEIDQALAAYERVLDVDPGQAELASRVAALLARQNDFPRAIDVLKDAIKAQPKEPAPYLQLAFIYSKYLQKPDQALKFANQAIALDPKNIEAYERAFEIEMTGGGRDKALQVLEHATKSGSTEPEFWTQLGKLYASIVFKSDQPDNADVTPKPDELRRVNAIFTKAAELSKDDPAILKDVADYFAASQQIQEAIPLYLKVLELQPDDANAREKLATGFVLTNQRAKAVEMLEQIIKTHPEKFQPYDLLAQLLDEDARTLQRANQNDRAKAEFAKAAASYEQSLLIDPTHSNTYVRLAELLIGPLKESERAMKILTEARRRFPDVPAFSYYLALAQREAKHAQQAIITFEEALHEAELSGSEVANARFYFDYGAAADQAGLYDKAADLFRKSIALDPPNAAEAYNYLGFMWAEHNMHLEEAEEMIKRALQIDPNNGAYLDSLGWLDYRKGKLDQALSELMRAAQNISHPDPVVFDHIADTYSKLNKVPQALEYWQKAIALDPGNKVIADKIENTKTKMSKGNPPKNPIP
jgi:tetratricopeptide (TPR) repeat protein